MGALHNTIIIFLMGILGIWKAIPVGFVLKADPVLICIMTILGAFVGILILYFFGTATKRYILKRLEKKGMQKKSGRVDAIFQNYGILGLGLLGTLIIGPNMTMALGMVVVKSEKLLLLWTAIGTVIWTVVLTLVASYSIELIQQLAIF